MQAMLSPDDISRYKTQGYLLLNNFLTIDECRTMRERAAALLAAFDPNLNPRLVFHAKGNEHVSNSNLMESTDNISFFFAAHAFSLDGRLLCDKTEAIVKIGHALHDCDPVFQRYSHGPKMHEIARNLGYKRPLIGQSRYFYKLPRLKGVISPHQDSTVLYTEPLSCYAIWLALENATHDNGCLWVIPGSHHMGLRVRVIRDEISGKSRLISLGTFAPLDDSSFIPLEVAAGTAVLFCGELVHKSNQNISTRSRQAYAVHFIEGDKSHKYPVENWLQRPGGFGELHYI